MTDKELKKLRRADLLGMLLDASKEIAELSAQNLELVEKLKEKHIEINNAGSIAEAALKLNDVFEAADAAVAQYIDNFSDCNDRANKIITEAETKAETIEKEATLKADTLVKCATGRADTLLKDANESAEKMVKNAVERAELIVQEAQLNAAAIEQDARLKANDIENKAFEKAAHIEIVAKQSIATIEQNAKEKSSAMEQAAYQRAAFIISDAKNRTSISRKSVNHHYYQPASSRGYDNKTGFFTIEPRRIDC